MVYAATAVTALRPKAILAKIQLLSAEAVAGPRYCCTGGVRTLEGAERVLDRGQADLVGVGRAVLERFPMGKKCY